jgi:hypothetical protein
MKARETGRWIEMKSWIKRELNREIKTAVK